MRKSLTDIPVSGRIKLTMKGTIRRNRDKFYIDLHYQGERIRIYSDRDGAPLDSLARAERLLAHIRYEIDHGLFDRAAYVRRELKALLFENYAEAWYERQVKRAEQGLITKGYLKNIRHRLDHLVRFFRGKRITEIRAGHIEDLLVELPVGVPAKRNILATLHKILADAERRQDIQKVPPFPKVDMAEPEIRWLTLEEQEKVLVHIRDKVMWALFLFLMDTGCRIGEGRALRWERVDLKKQVAVIAASMDMDSYKPASERVCVHEPPGQATIPLPGV